MEWLLELIVEFILEVVVGGSIEGVSDSKLPKGVRIGLLIFATLIYVAFTAFFIYLSFVEDNIVVKVISIGVVIFFVGLFVSLWRKVLKARK